MTGWLTDKITDWLTDKITELSSKWAFAIKGIHNLIMRCMIDWLLKSLATTLNTY